VGILPRLEQELAGALQNGAVARARGRGTLRGRRRLIDVVRGDERRRLLEKLRAVAVVLLRPRLPRRAAGGNALRAGPHHRRDQRAREHMRDDGPHRPANPSVTTISSCSATSLSAKRHVDAASSTQWPSEELTTLDRRTRARLKSQPDGSMTNCRRNSPC